MNIASMFLRILAILGAIAAGVMFWMIGDTKERLESDLASTQSQLNSTQSNLSNLQSEHEELQQEAETLTQNLQESESRANNLDNELSQVRQELAEANQLIRTRQQEAEQLEAEAARIRQELLAEKQRADELLESLEGADAEALRASVRELETQLLRTEQELQNLGAAAVVAETTDEQRRTVLRGEVTEVGDQSAYIVIDLGQTAGAQPNATVMLRRGPQYVGRAQIREVRENVSIAEVMPGSSPVQTGDQAVTLN